MRKVVRIYHDRVSYELKNPYESNGGSEGGLSSDIALTTDDIDTLWVAE